MTMKIPISLFSYVSRAMMANPRPQGISVLGHIRPVENAGSTQLRKVNFNQYVAIEQNPRTGSEWAIKARAGQKVVQFKDFMTNEYVAVSVDGTVIEYPKR